MTTWVIPGDILVRVVLVVHGVQLTVGVPRNPSVVVRVVLRDVNTRSIEGDLGHANLSLAAVVIAVVHLAHNHCLLPGASPALAVATLPSG